MSRTPTFGTPPANARSNVVRLPRQPNPHGKIEIFPCALNGGCWGVEHRSADRNVASFLGAVLAWSDAVQLARRWATKIGADFDESASS